MVTDLINLHLSRWVNTISDISNSNQESIDRLEDYKSIIQRLNETIDTYALNNNVPLIIEENKSKRWTDSFGFDINRSKSSKYSMKNLLNYLFKGYSKLQNEFYLDKLSSLETYSSFPQKIYENVNFLRQNSYDNIESTIDQIINLIKINLPCNSFSGENTPMNTYFEFNKENTICSFCNQLISSYDYPKDKIIEFIIFYLQNRYHLLENHSEFVQKNFWESNEIPLLEKNLFKSYIILFDLWIKSAGPTLKNEKYTKIMKNLFIVNKSYFHFANCLDPQFHYYNDYESIVLSIPIYLYNLMESIRIDDDDDDDTDSDDYDSSISG